MSKLDQSLIDDARALLAAFGCNDLRRLTIKLRPDVELRLERDLQAPAGTAVKAPHVATVAEGAEEGRLVAAGEVIAQLDLLGERINVQAPLAGVIGSPAVKGDLMQFGEAVAWIEGVDPA